MRLSFDDEESFKEVVGSICFNNPPSDRNSLGRVSSTPSQERGEDIDTIAAWNYVEITCIQWYLTCQGQYFSLLQAPESSVCGGIMINGALMVILKKRSKRFDSRLVSSDQYFPEQSVKTTNTKLKFDLLPSQFWFTNSCPCVFRDSKLLENLKIRKSISSHSFLNLLHISASNLHRLWYIIILKTGNFEWYYCF